MKHINRDGTVDYDDFNYEDPEKDRAYRKERWRWEQSHLLKLGAVLLCSFFGIAFVIMLIGKLFG